MPDFFRINYAPVVRVDEPTPAVLYPRNTYRRARGIAALNPTISLAAVDIEVQPTGAGYMAVNYTLDDLAVPFTIRQKPNFAGQTSFIPCISWIDDDGTLSRYALANDTIGVNQYELYTSQLIDPATAMIELWARGIRHDHTAGVGNRYRAARSAAIQRADCRASLHDDSVHRAGHG